MTRKDLDFYESLEDKHCQAFNSIICDGDYTHLKLTALDEWIDITNLLIDAIERWNKEHEF